MTSALPLVRVAADFEKCPAEELDEKLTVPVGVELLLTTTLHVTLVPGVAGFGEHVTFTKGCGSEPGLKTMTARASPAWEGLYRLELWLSHAAALVFRYIV